MYTHWIIAAILAVAAVLTAASPRPGFGGHHGHVSYGQQIHHGGFGHGHHGGYGHGHHGGFGHGHHGGHGKSFVFFKQHFHHGGHGYH